MVPSSALGTVMGCQVAIVESIENINQEHTTKQYSTERNRSVDAYDAAVGP